MSKYNSQHFVRCISIRRNLISVTWGRGLRRDFKYAFHHVMNRAGAKRLIFFNDQHRIQFLKVLQHVVSMDEIEIHAFCLMSNHYHLLVCTPKQNLSASMQRLSSMFTRRFNRAEKIDGPLFRGRFKSIIVGHDDYLRQLCRYIHRNPVAANIVKTPQEYEWSSYRFYAGIAARPKWLTIEELPKYFPSTKQGPDFWTFIETETPVEDIFGEATLFKLKQEESKYILMPSQCLSAPIVDQSYYLAPASLTDVIEEVIAHCQLGRDALSCRVTVKNTPRDICMYLAREEACLRILDIANAFNIRKAAASMAIARVKHLMEIDAILKQLVIDLKTRIRFRRKQMPAWTELKNI